MNEQKILVCIDFANHSKEIILDYLKRSTLYNESKIILFNGVGQVPIFDTFSVTLTPTQESFESSIREPILGELENIKNDIQKILPNSKIETRCVLYPSVKKAATDIIEEENIALVIVANEAKGAMDTLFTSSFTDFVIHHSKAAVLVCK